MQDDKEVELVKQEDIEFSSAIEESGKAPIVKLVDLMLNQALRSARRIYIEPEARVFKDTLPRIGGALPMSLKYLRQSRTLYWPGLNYIKLGYYRKPSP